MVVGTAAAVTIICTGGAAIAPIAASATVGGSAGATAAVAGTASAVGTAVGAGTAGGAIAGAGAVATAGTGAGVGIIASCAVMGGLVGGTAAAGVGGTGAGAGALLSNKRTDGLVLLAVGASVNQEDDEISYDCWKPVVHDTSPERSNGMLLKDMVCHPNVANVTMTTGICDSLPSILIENIWNEKFEIEYVVIHDSGKIACHAKPL
ncbi:Golgi-associated RAB2B interactor protein 3-like [Ruditapes philippinarum]|uniref:Golgi-associated RAB2B interactor protein 3-like n=1 Tax=Ruditapes philippinarum TaxID=129788 RepID=UPI00295AF8DF|nr:Golgi-associated RAB2B interactor protein 3-like [Ruditapes philippinarum]XP_060582017.1 Golgi-associated RAB2B interactor protein 3-like [Ruditapes philippinarum]